MKTFDHGKSMKDYLLGFIGTSLVNRDGETKRIYSLNDCAHICIQCKSKGLHFKAVGYYGRKEGYCIWAPNGVTYWEGIPDRSEVYDIE